MDPYAVLDVSRDASVAEIRKAYVALARSTHPDVRGDDPSAAEQMRRINLAWETLSDTDSRAALDRSLRERPHFGGAGQTDSGARRSASDGFDRTSHPSDDGFDLGRDDSGHDDFDGFDLGHDDFGHDDFDGDDRAITEGSLPAWMRLGAPAAFVVGVFAVIFGVLAGGFLLVRLGLMSLGFSVVLFVLSPFVVLIRSRHTPARQ